METNDREMTPWEMALVKLYPCSKCNLTEVHCKNCSDSNAYNLIADMVDKYPNMVIREEHDALLEATENVERELFFERKHRQIVEKALVKMIIEEGKQ